MGRKMQNVLNDLDGSQWLYWTDTLYITNYPPDATHKLRKAHGAMKPPEVMAEIINFFTKKGELVLDPFAGVGGTLLGAALTGRQALGFEIDPRWVKIYEEIKEGFVVYEGRLVAKKIAPAGPLKGDPVGRDKDEPTMGSDSTEAAVASQPSPADPLPITGEMRIGDCLHLMAEMADASVDALITDPPYGAQHGATGFAGETNFNMVNTGAALDFSNAPDFSAYLDLMRRFGDEAWRVLKPGRYLVIMVGDRYRNGEYIPLGYQVAEKMRQAGFKLKGIKIWSNQATRRPLKPYAVLSSFVPNITHQNILILKKE